MRYLFMRFKDSRAYKAANPTLLYQNCYRSSYKGKLLHFLPAVLLFLTGFLMISLTSRADDWWTTGAPYAVKDHFKVSFDATKGQFTIRAFAIDKGYFSHSTLAATNVTLSYTTDGVTYNPFFKFSYTPHWQDTDDESQKICFQLF